MARFCSQIHLIIAALFWLFISMGQSHATKIAVSENSASIWDGIWFTCEFAQRQRAPDDGCQMFDDEGFIYKNGTLSYLRIIGSEEVNCRGQKKGQCFKRNKHSINVSQKEIGEARIEGNRLIVRYLGCEQGYLFQDGQDYVTIKPENKACFWSRERHFYVAPFTGRLTIIK